MEKTRVVLRFLVLAFMVSLALPADPASGDGIFIPNIVYKTPPSIPTQRAILKYRDGQEQLIIESALDAEGQSFGWVIPLPSVPTEIKKGTPGMLKTLDNVCQPRITHQSEYLTICMILAALAFVVAVLSIWRRFTSGEAMLLFGLTVILIVAFVAPALSSAVISIGQYSKAVSVKTHQVIGNYDVSVLQAKTPQALSNWLKENDFASLAAEDQKIVGDYIREGWCFLTAKLRRDGKGLSVPHPISATFATDSPVYPMRLTALTGKPVALDLFIVADKQAKVEHLEREFCDVFSGPNPKRTNNRIYTSQAGFKGTLRRSEIGFPSVCEILWDGCVVTRLSGELQPKQMTQDYRIEFEQTTPGKAHYYSYQGAHRHALIYVVPLACFLMLIMPGIAHKRIARPGGRMFAVKAIMLPLLLAIPIAFGCTYALLPKVKIVDTGRSTFEWYQSSNIRGMTTWMHMLRTEKQDFAGMDINAIRTAVADHIADPAKWIKEYRNMTEEASPDNYILLEDDRGVVFRGFDVFGFPWDVVLKPTKQQ